MAAVHAMRWSMGGVEGLRWWGMRYYNFGGMHFGVLMGGWWCIQEAQGMGLGHGVWGQWALIGAFPDGPPFLRYCEQQKQDKVYPRACS